MYAIERHNPPGIILTHSKKSHQAYSLTFYGFMQFETIKRNPFLPYGDQRPRSISSNAKNTHRVCLTGFFEDGSDGSTFFGSGLSGLGTLRQPLHTEGSAEVGTGRHHREEFRVT